MDVPYHFKIVPQDYIVIHYRELARLLIMSLLRRVRVMPIVQRRSFVNLVLVDRDYKKMRFVEVNGDAQMVLYAETECVREGVCHRNFFPAYPTVPVDQMVFVYRIVKI
jgi:hypothetical protein